MKEFKGKVAVITGGANGLGLEIAKEALRREMKIVIADIDKSSLERTENILSEIGGEFHLEEMDVTLYENMSKLADLSMKRYGSIDLFFNNAGVVVSALFGSCLPRTLTLSSTPI